MVVVDSGIEINVVVPVTEMEFVVVVVVVIGALMEIVVVVVDVMETPLHWCWEGENILWWL